LPLPRPFLRADECSRCRSLDRIVWPRGEHIEVTSSGGNFIERILHRVSLVVNGGSSSSNFRPRLGCHAEAITTPPVTNPDNPPHLGSSEKGEIVWPTLRAAWLNRTRKMVLSSSSARCLDVPPQGGRASGKESYVYKPLGYCPRLYGMSTVRAWPEIRMTNHPARSDCGSVLAGKEAIRRAYLRDENKYPKGDVFHLPRVQARLQGTGRTTRRRALGDC
jgi:hypothetical protein